LQALLDENSARTLEELAKALNVGKLIVSNCLHAIGKIQKEDKWISHELSELAGQNRLIICTSLLFCHKKKQFLYQIVTNDEKWIYYDNPKRKKLING